MKTRVMWFVEFDQKQSVAKKPCRVMKASPFLVAAALLVAAAALAQLRIPSFNSSGELAWTN